MTFLEFMEKQEAIYEEFRDTSKIESEGIIPKIVDNQGGYIIAYRHSNEVVEGICKFSEKVSKIIPSIRYNEDNIHSTLATFQVADDFNFDATVMENITKLVCATLPLTRNVRIEYKEWLINQDSGILCGNPNSAFFENAKRIVEYAVSKGVQLKLPWGAHITVSRFLERASKQQVIELLDLFKGKKAIGISTPHYVDVGYYFLTGKEFKFKVYRRFEL